MRRIVRPPALLLGVVTFLAVGLVVPALARDRLGDILARPDAFDGREVVLDGKVSALGPRTSRRGNDYCVFRLLGQKGTSIKVFSWGKPAIAPGDRLEVRGRFQRERRVGRYTFTDEVEASRIRKLP